MEIFVSVAFKQYPDDKLVTFTNTVYQKMSTDTQYTTLKSYIDDIRVKNDAFIAGIALASRRDTGLIADRKNLKEILLKHLVKVARRLEDLTADNGNNPRIITDAGFEVRNTTKTEKEPVTALDIPVLTVTTTDNKPGMAKLNWKTVVHALNYAIRHKKMTETAWQNGDYNDKGEFTFTNLESGHVYEFEVCALGSNSISSGFSTTVRIYVS